MVYESNKNREDKNLALKSGVWYVISTFITKGLAFLLVPFFARYMTKSDFGEFSNFANWQSVLTILVGLELYQSLSIAYFDYREEYKKYISSLCVFTVITSSVVHFLLIHNNLFILTSIPSKYSYLMLFVIIFQNIRQIYLAKERTLYNYKSVSTVSFCSLSIPLLVSFALVYCFEEVDKLDGRIYGFYVPYAAIGAICFIEMLREKTFFAYSHIKYALRVSLPLLILHFTTYAITSMNIIIVKKVIGAESAATISIVTSVMNIIMILFQSANGALTTWIMDCLEKNNYSKIRDSFRFYLISSLLVTFFVVLLGPEIVMIMGGIKYLHAIYLIPPFAVSVYFQVICSMYSIVLTYEKAAHKISYISIFVALSSVALKYIFLNENNMHILPYINMLGYCFILGSICITVISINQKKCLNYSDILTSFSASGGLLFISQSLYENNCFRYFIIVILIASLATLCYKKRRKIYMITKKNN